MFNNMMQALYNEKGASLRIEIMHDKPVQEFIEAHASVLDSSFKQVEMSDIMRRRLQRSDYIFSGLKTFHELNEAFPSLLDENGDRKPFERFLNDVQKINKTYNQNYLRAEYNFASASAEMAARWEQFMDDGDRYYLQYRTAADGKVRPEHAALHGVTLPIDDPFWEQFYPPNGWNCRCSVTQVRKSKYPATPHNEAMALGEVATQRDTRQMFRFNPGKEQKTFPNHNPYTISRCKTCDIESKLASKVSDNDLCAACQCLRQAQSQRAKKRPTLQEFIELKNKTLEWANDNLDIITFPNASANNNPTKRSYATSSDGNSIGVGKVFFNELLAKNKRNPLLPDIVEASIHFKQWIAQATRVRIESGRHHSFDFAVYHATWNGYNVEFKCKLTDGELLYNMTFI